VLFDALGFKFRELAVKRDPHCAVCGDAPSITEPIDYVAFCGVRGEEADVDAKGIPTITVEEFETRRKNGSAPPLIDVRDRHEFDIVQIPGSRLLPLGDQPSRLHELDSAETYVLSCHHGTRSVQAYHLLRKAGFAHLQVLGGGVDSWALKIDPSLPRY
jgi:adenylyltransferase/sulfurtransferase